MRGSTEELVRFRSRDGTPKLVSESTHTGNTTIDRTVIKEVRVLWIRTWLAILGWWQDERRGLHALVVQRDSAFEMHSSLLKNDPFLICEIAGKFAFRRVPDTIHVNDRLKGPIG